VNPGLLGLIAALCWGTGDFAARYTSRAIGPAQTLMFLSLATVLVLSPVVIDRDLAPLWEPTTLLLAVLTGIVSTIAGLMLYKSLAMGPLGVVVPITSTYPLPLVLIVILMGELTLSWGLGAAMIAVVGGVWVVARAGHKTDYDEHHALGSLKKSMLLAGATALIFPIAMLITEAAVSRAGEVEVIWFSRIIETILLAVIIFPRKKFTPISLRMLGLLAVLGLIDTIGFVALFTAQGTGDTAIAAVASATYGLVTVVLARVFLKEPVKPVQWIGFMVVVVGAATLTLLSA